MKKTLAVFPLILAFQWVSAQNTIGLPEIINYTRKQYEAGSQNWDIKKDRNGVLYFANNDGLLTFDGVHWKKYPLPNRSIVRSVSIGPGNIIYVGGQEELGYFYPDKQGRLAYQSLMPLVPKDESSFADVWDIAANEYGIFFRSNRKILLYRHGTISVYKSIDWSFMGESNGRLYAQDYERGMLVFQNGYWIPFLKKNDLGKDVINCMASVGRDSSLLFGKQQAYLLKGDSLSVFTKGIVPFTISQKAYASVGIGRGQVLIGTNLGGCYIVDRNGELIQRLARPDGIQNNNVLSLLLDESRNIWLGLDNGIDFIAYDNAIKKIKPDWQNSYAGYTSAIYGGRIYIGTSAGLFSAPLPDQKDLSFVKSSFSPIKYTEGQVWTLNVVNGQLLMGHNNGAFQIIGEKAYPVDPTTGFWTFQPLNNVMPSPRILAGCYNGINFYDYAGGRFTNPSVHAHFESARFVINENGQIWVAHPYKGLYRVTIGNDNKFTTTVYPDKKKILSTNDNYLFRIHGRTVLVTQKGIFEFSQQQNEFIASSYFRNILGNAIPTYMKEDRSGNVWFVSARTPGVIDFSGKKPLVRQFRELQNRVTAGGYEFIDPVDENNILIAGEDGFYHLNYLAYKGKAHRYKTLITSVKATSNKDSLLYEGYSSDNRNIPFRVGSAWGTFRFEYAATLYGPSTVEYSYRLSGFDGQWSAWTSKTEKEYTNLPAGNYHFEVRSRLSETEPSEVVAGYQFRILPPWYQTRLAYAAYIAFVVAAIGLLYKHQQERMKRQQARHEEEQRQMQYLHQLKMEKTEKELVQLKNEKLEAEILHKNTELASSAMHLVQKGELLSRIREKLIKLDKDAEKQKASEEFRGIIKILGQDDKMDANWTQFAEHFNEVHGNFLLALKKKYGDLTANELKLCAYLRMNMSTKEIAQLMNISVRGVEIGRYRLRKKLQLQHHETFFDVLINIEETNGAPKKKV